MAPNGQVQSKIRMQTQKRTHFNPFGEPAISTLKAPMVRIENHKSEVISCEFHPSGKYILSSNREGLIHICDIYGTFSKMMVMEGHTDAVMETHFSRDGFDVYSCSSDGTLGIWDTFGGTRKSTLQGHKGSVNCMQGNKIGYPLLCSGSDDGTIRIWDTREHKSTLTIESEKSKLVTACSFSETGEYVFSGGCDGNIEIWDLRQKKLLNVLFEHTDKITGVSLSPCGGYLLSHSKDNTLRVWDVGPYTDLNREIRCFRSSHDGVDNLLRCKWSHDGSMISAGTSERDVFVWDSDSGEIIYDLPGHNSNVNDVAFHPREQILLSASSDTFLFLHEIN
ncbi:U5 small nuclear ribonucleoprotein 40 kDa protein-like [Episyrphus balteatus]|uniref:U5 small nuclear ribonucleoprotein 40 kDa protein-like n=1 Tax=Episyrphus balteatus TaxID=286459 RepID=UPI002485C416|nr:U5 small nuclear ribonucleoprotein 40 kDa protein-like [Episyrphus balteatus]